MKLFCIILSFYAFGLSTLPCCVDDKCVDDVENEYTEGHSQDHANQDINTCSPFFSCGTCSGFIFAKSGLVIKIIPVTGHKTVFPYISQFADGSFVKIWQPPKIG